MFEAIILGMAKSLASYLFSGYLKAHYGSIEIDNAPSWYGKEPREAVCVSDYSPYGGIQKIEIVKNRTKNGDYYLVFATVYPIMGCGSQEGGYISCRRKASRKEIAAAEALYKTLK